MDEHKYIIDQMNYEIFLAEEGMKLSKECNKMLEDAEKKITILLEKDGKIEEEDFDNE